MLKKKPRRSREFKRNFDVIDLEEAREERRKKRSESGKSRKKVNRDTAAQAVMLEEKQSARKRVKKNRRRLIYTAIMLIIVAVIGLSIYNIITLHVEKSQLEAKNAALMAEREKLQNEIKNVDNPEYIEQQAREQLRLIKPGEILYVLPPKAEKSNATESALEEDNISNNGNN